MPATTLGVADVTYAQVAKTIDHSLLRPELTVDEIVVGCALALRYDVASVCVRPADVPRAVRLLGGTTVAVGTVVGFPHGSSATATKVAEAALLRGEGAAELDMVLTIGWLRSGEDAAVEADIAAVVGVADGALVKVILENAYLSDAEKVRGCRIAEAAGADFVKTSTGFAKSGATVADVALMRRTVGPDLGVKASGGVKGIEDARAMVEAGATRIGASVGVKIAQEAAGVKTTATAAAY